MPRNQSQRMIFALLTVVITVHLFVFYSIYVVNGRVLMEVTGADTVLGAVRAQRGIYMFGHMLPVRTVILVEFVFAYTLENLVGSPASFALARRKFDPKTTNPIIFESAVISATAGIMCPAMSFIAALIYYPYYDGFSLISLLAGWMKLVCFNFPFAYFTQMYAIQPAVRKLFRTLYRKDIAKRKTEKT